MKKIIDTDGKMSLLHCKNHDWKINNPPIVIEFNPAGKYKYLTTTNIGRGLLYQGMNEKGISVTNHFLSDELTSPAVRNSCERYQIIRKYMESGKVNTIDELISVLSDTGASYGVNNINTTHSVIFNGRKFEIYFAFGSGFAASGKWLKYDWKDDVVTVYKKPVK